MALRPRTVKAGSLAAIAVPTVLGSTLLSPASAFAPVVQDIPGGAPQGSLFTATAQSTLSQVAVQVRQQAEAPATNQVQPIQQTYTAQATQAAQTEQATPATFQSAQTTPSAQATQTAPVVTEPTLSQVANAQTAQAAQSTVAGSTVPATRTGRYGCIRSGTEQAVRARHLPGHQPLRCWRDLVGGHGAQRRVLPLLRFLLHRG